MKIKVKTPKKRLGHPSHLSGSGQMDNRPKRERTRNDQKRNWKILKKVALVSFKYGSILYGG